MRNTKSTTLAAILLFAVVSSTQAQSGPSVKQHPKQFSLLVRVPLSYTPQQVKAATPQWEALIEQWKSQGVYVVSFAFPGQSFTVNGPDKTVKEEAIACNSMKVVSNLVLQVADIQQAIGLAKQCPVLAFGGSVEVREIPKPILTDKP